MHIDQPDAWNGLVTKYKTTIQQLLAHDDIAEHLRIIDTYETHSVFGSVLQAVTASIAAWQTFDSALYSQLVNIAAILNISVLKVFLLQLMYEINARCTSVVLRTKKGTVVHGRTMDWGIALLEKLSVPVAVYANKKQIGSCMHFVGCVGMFTCMRNHAYSITINFRVFNKKDSLKNAISIINKRLGWLNPFGTMVDLLRTMGATNDTLQMLSQLVKIGYGMVDNVPVTFLLRNILLENATYEQALHRLKTAPIFTQIYFTIAGVKNGAIVARSPVKVDGLKELTPSTRYIIQPNMDWWSKSAVDIMHSKKRTCTMEKILNKSYADQDAKKNVAETLWDAMKKGGHPRICNPITVYSTLFVPSHDVFYYTIGN